MQIRKKIKEFLKNNISRAQFEEYLKDNNDVIAILCKTYLNEYDNKAISKQEFTNTLKGISKDEGL